MDIIFQWFSDLLEFFGLKNKEGTLMFIGLDNAGKTTLLGVLRDGFLKQVIPTLHPTSEELVINKITFTCHDLGGHIEARKIWPNFFPAVNGIVFIVDCTDTDRLEEAKKELSGILTNVYIKHIPVLVLGNKIDNPKALSEDKLRASLGLLQNITTGKNTSNEETKKLGIRPVEVFMCSVLQRTGFKEGFMWISKYI